MAVADKYMSDYMSGPVHEINKLTAKKGSSLMKKLKNPPAYKPKKKKNNLCKTPFRRRISTDSRAKNMTKNEKRLLINGILLPIFTAIILSVLYVGIINALTPDKGFQMAAEQGKQVNEITLLTLKRKTEI